MSYLYHFTPLYQALLYQTDMLHWRLSDYRWKRPPGRQQNKLFYEIRSGNSLSPTDMWKRAMGHWVKVIGSRSLSPVDLRRGATVHWVKIIGSRSLRGNDTDPADNEITTKKTA